MSENVTKQNNSEMIPDILVGSSSPHIRTNESVTSIMRDVIIALVPAMIGSVYFFGFDAVRLLAISVIAAVVSEVAMQKLFKKEVTISDMSAVVTGILLAFNIPANAPWYLPVFGSAFAIIVVKQLFGGLGQNFMNPALAGRAALMASWPEAMTTFTAGKGAVDAMSSATPLGLMEAGEQMPALSDMFLGKISGTIGEVSALLLLIGGIYLIYKEVIDWKVPIVYIGTTAITLAGIFLFQGVDLSLIIYQILSGGLILGAFFMATDYVSIPVTPKGRVVFAIGAGFLTAVIRVFGGYPEGVSYSILLMNVVTPLIEKFTMPKVFGRED